MRPLRVTVALFWAMVAVVGFWASPDSRLTVRGPQFADAATRGVVKSLKRAMNQGWRNGAHSICAILGCDYEHVKAHLTHKPTFFHSFKAVCAQLDEFEEEVTHAKMREEDLTPSQREYRWLLLSKGAALINDALGTQFEVPASYVPHNAKNRHYIPGQRGEGDEKEKLKTRMRGLQVVVPLPTLEEIQKDGMDRLAAVREKHMAQIKELEDARHRKFLLLQEEHDRQTDQLVSELRLKHTEEMDTIRRELAEERRLFEQSVKVWDAVSRLLTDAHVGIETLTDRVHTMSQHVFKLNVFYEKLHSFQQTAKENPTGAAPYSALSYAFQSEAAVDQAMHQIVAIYQEASAGVARVQEILNQADGVMATAPTRDDAAWFQQRQRGYKDRLESFVNLLSDLSVRLEDYMQTAEERKLVTLFLGDEVRTQILALLQERTTEWSTRLATLRERTQGIETAANKFFESSTQLDRTTGEVVSAVLQNPEAFLVQVSTYATESGTLRSAAGVIEEDLKAVVKALQDLGREMTGLTEGVASAQLPPAVLDFLGLPGLFNALQVDMQVKAKGQQLLQLIKGRLSQTGEITRKLEMLKSEVKNIRSPAVREQAEWALTEASTKLQDVLRTKAEVELEIQQINLQLQQVQGTVTQLDQRIAHERVVAQRAAAGGSAAAGLRGGSLALGGSATGSMVGLGGSVSGLGTDSRAAIADLEQKRQNEKEKIQELRHNLSSKQRESVSLDNEARRLEVEVANKQRELAEEQQRVLRVATLAQALTTGASPNIGMSMASMRGGLGLTGGLAGSSAALMTQGIMGSRAAGLLGGSTAGLAGASMGGLAGGSMGGLGGAGMGGYGGGSMGGLGGRSTDGQLGRGTR
uniref:Putative transmembrane protein n=1 Tax=Toxoplasma gondii COUG TaxID=1074873 RepID=A0A2G8Y274_TOXGO|nr:putative transmembrane protein [Toxoplasma gondii COUG]